MDKTLQLLSIQNELVMAIGHNLRLRPMLNHFTRVCVKRLSLLAIHYFLPTDDNGNATFKNDRQNIDLQQYFSYPDKDENFLTSCKNCILTFDDYDFSTSGLISYSTSKNEYIYVFGLEDIGCIILRKLGRPLDDAIIQSLTPIFNRLSISAHRSIEHEQLLSANKARDIAEEKMLFQLDHDHLTKLSNRRSLIKKLDQELSRCHRNNNYGGLMFIDLDRFKTINDTLGHAVGDELLCAIAGMLESAVRKEDTVVRLGGDEFVILLTSIGDTHQKAVQNIYRVSDKLFTLFSQPVVTPTNVIHTNISIGMNTFSGDEKLTAEEEIQRTDVAMYHAKLTAGSSAFFFNPDISRNLQKRLDLEKDLREAIKLEQFELHYQPQFNALHEIIGAEALIRWPHPEHGYISPAEFIPIAEYSGLIIDIGNWVLHTTCRHIRKLESQNIPASFKRISANVSSIQLAHKNFVETVIDSINDTLIDSRHLGLEITESSLIDNIDDATHKVRILNRIGIHFSIDDFGTGYSSLSYLKQIPVKTLKIDQAFVHNMDKNNDSKIIASTILALAKGLGLSTIAEGVETESELNCLINMGCKDFQGFYFSKPVPFDELEELLTTDLVTVPEMHS
ncbi:MAG: EAL domain-containing protein [Gammaproteobacteria bacterium]